MNDSKMRKAIRKPAFLIFYSLYFVFRIIARFLYHPITLRNEARGSKGSFVIIANHQSALDIVLLTHVLRRRFFTVFSSTYYYSLPKFARRLTDRCGAVHKQQFQTKAGDLKTMKKIIDSGNPLLIFPAGLMCEDGIENPHTRSTASFLKWLGTDVYMTKITGSYFVMPKWSSLKRPGKTVIDTYKLFSSKDLGVLPVEAIDKSLKEAFDIDAYKEQETLKFNYKKGDNTEGLEKVVYHCPVCGTKYSITSEGNKLSCSSCSFTETMDTMGFLHCDNKEQEIRHVSQWTRWIREERAKELSDDFVMRLSCSLSLLDGTSKGFRPVGKAEVTLTPETIILDGAADGQPLHLVKSLNYYPMLPFVPGKQFEIQDGEKSYRCTPDEPKYVTEFVNTVRILHRREGEQNHDDNGNS